MDISRFSSSSGSSFSWEALPPRKRSKAASSTNAPIADDGSHQSRHDALQQEENCEAPRDAVKVSRCKVADHQKILDNIEQRRITLKANGTLESKDGCAGTNYEYLDHTADVQCHSWGASLQEAFEHMATCMLNYMTDVSLITIDSEETLELTVEGHDLHALLYNYMTELLFRFSTDSFCAVKVEITSFQQITPPEAELRAKPTENVTAGAVADKIGSSSKGGFETVGSSWRLSARLHGDIFDPTRHTSGTEIKAITYSNMQIHQTEERSDLYVIVDI